MEQSNPALRHSLDKLFRPKAIAVIGASNKPGRPGYMVTRNLLEGHYNGAILPISLKHQTVCGILAYNRLDIAPITPDIAIICTRGDKISDILLQLSAAGTHQAIILATGLASLMDKSGQFANLLEKIEHTAHKLGIRLLGPNSLGLLLPHQGINASYAHTGANPGSVALISQSTTLCATVLDWAQSRDIGFSAVVSLGDSTDIGFGEVIDQLSKDPKTHIIVLCIETIKFHRRFLSAARAAAFNKPVLVLKTGKHSATDAKHKSTTSLECTYDAAIRRAGMVRVKDLHELFAALQILAHSRPLSGEHLTVVTNGGGAGMMATDTLLERGGRLTKLAPETIAKLNTLLPPGAHSNNPVDLLGDAPPKRYLEVVEVLLDSPEVDNVLIIHVPTAVAPAKEFAKILLAYLKSRAGKRTPNILFNWMGEHSAAPARQLFSKAGWPDYRTPEGAVRALMYRVQYRRNQKQLLETPDPTPYENPARLNQVKSLLNQHIEQGQLSLDNSQSQQIAATYGLCTASREKACNPEELQAKAAQLGFPVTVYPVSSDRKESLPTIYASNLQELTKTTSELAVKTDKKLCWHVEKQLNPKQFIPLHISVYPDRAFGPVILLGQGGNEWNPDFEAVAALPPLNMNLARYQIIQALTEQKIQSNDAAKHLDIPILCRLLTRLSQLVIDCPQILTLDLNLYFNREQQLAQKVVISLQNTVKKGFERFAIRPYPADLEETFQLHDGHHLLIRPIRPEDEDSQQSFDHALSPEDRYKRYFGERPAFTHTQMALLTQIDYEREMVFVAVDSNTRLNPETFAVIRICPDPLAEQAEFALVVSTSMQGKGLGKKLLTKAIDYCQQHNIQYLSGFTMPTNLPMIHLARKLGFNTETDFEEGMTTMTLLLDK